MSDPASVTAPPYVLDLDLDFFLAKVPPYPYPAGQRPEDHAFPPWSESDVRRFLEGRCGLSASAPTPGAVVEHHHLVLREMRQLVYARSLAVPFDLVHVDAHADLGGSFDPSPCHILTDLLMRPPAERIERAIRGSCCANWLAYAICCRWLGSLVYVRHPRARRDLLNLYFEDSDSTCDRIRLDRFTKEQLDRYWALEPGRWRQFRQSLKRTEPAVPFEKCRAEEFKPKRPFDLVFLSHSPDYTPAASDSLIPVIKEYMKLDGAV